MVGSFETFPKFNTFEITDVEWCGFQKGTQLMVLIDIKDRKRDFFFFVLEYYGVGGIRKHVPTQNGSVFF